jgi:SnoaL-like domain
MHEVDAQWGASLRPPIEASVEMLLHLEAIWLLRPRYCRFVDLKLWDELEDILTPDTEVFSNNDVGMPPREVPVANSPAEFRARLSGITDGAITVHAVFNPEIEVIGARSARGIWAMSDIVSHPTKPGLRFTGRGHYTDEYRLCDDGRWRICKATLTRLRLDPLPLPEVDAVIGQPGGRTVSR